MASVSQLNQFPCKSFSVTPLRSQLRPLLLESSVGIPSRFAEGVRISSQEFAWAKPIFRVPVTDDDEWGPKKDEPVKEISAKDEPAGESSTVAVAEEEKSVESKEIAKLKKALVDSFYGTDRGLKALSEMRVEIVELITHYTSFPCLFLLLSRGTLPLVKIEEISQTIDSENFTVQNSVQFSGPLATTLISTNAKFDLISQLDGVTDELVSENAVSVGLKSELEMAELKVQTIAVDAVLSNDFDTLVNAVSHFIPPSLSVVLGWVAYLGCKLVKLDVMLDMDCRVCANIDHSCSSLAKDNSS
ncbi:hypothetical protein UlMin_012573 [Ulmus minor]